MNEQVRQQEAGDASKAPLWIAIALLLAGVVGYYLLDASKGWLRWGSVVGGFVVGAAVFMSSALSVFTSRSIARETLTEGDSSIASTARAAIRRALR